MKRSLWLLVSVACVLAASGWIANQDPAWAAPGNSPARQTYPSRTPTAEPVVSTNTPPPPEPGSPTQAPVPPTEAPTPVPVIPTPAPAIPTDTPSLTAGSPTTRASATSAVPLGTLSPTPTTGPRQPAGEIAIVIARALLAAQEAVETGMTPTVTEGSPWDPAATLPSTEAQLVSTPVGTATTQPVVPRASGIGASWLLVGGLVLIAAAGLLLILGRRQ